MSDILAEAVSGMGIVPVLFAVGLAGVAAVVWRFGRRGRLPWTTLVCGERGAAYSLAYVMVVPVFLAFLSLVFEAGQLMLGKMATMYAAHCGARSLAVWSSARPEDVRTARVEQSVRTAMAPFMSGRKRDGSFSFSPSALLQAEEFKHAYEAYSAFDRAPRRGAGQRYEARPATAEALRIKYRNAVSRTEVTQVADDPASVQVTVEYSAPLYVPGVTRFLDPDGSWPYEFPIRTTARLPNERPVSADGTIGIDYHSRASPLPF